MSFVIVLAALAVVRLGPHDLLRRAADLMQRGAQIREGEDRVHAGMRARRRERLAPQREDDEAAEGSPIVR